MVVVVITQASKREKNFVFIFRATSVKDLLYNLLENEWSALQLMV